MPNLAIVIPAYKQDFLEASIESIANQSNKDFTLYIGDDCSPYDLFDIVKPYVNKIPIAYKRFNENIGGNDLVAQWERCIDLVRDEEWIWLFSDDDLMDMKCVEDFYTSLKRYPDFDLFHFNVEIVDEADKVIDKFYSFPEISTAEEFILGKLQMFDYSTVVEFIFRKSHFYDLGRFQRFDLAWCSDDATWIKLSKGNGIRSIGNSKVYWRKSMLNISFNDRDKDIILRKLRAQVEFTQWICGQVKQNEINIESGILQKHLEKWFLEAVKWKTESISFAVIVNLMRSFQITFNKKKFSASKIIYLILVKL